MLAPRPRFLLIAEAESLRGSWRFALHGIDSNASVTACDFESDASDERLELLAVVRGLEALDQPSEVTLVTRSLAVRRGVKHGLEAWRNNHWRWERFGRLEPVRDADLWRRIDRALAFHRVRCRSWRADSAVSNPEPTRHASNCAETPPAFRSAILRPHFPVGTIGAIGDSPAMVVVPGRRTRRTVCLAPRRQPVAAAG
ncbi:RNase H family protein [Botrimarina hoheduenensis]|uniref:Ribonuclease HI n=1 Tax=Botrimarina hoheduenensis TaxID=2528000 RepID=A0A5C5WFX2_9BACT|nr:RNase H family protein [Botrimarina hoheduenensis]TWT48662.1 Ribonuclease HI [Botrimarina hoheduenensis]